MKLTALSHYSGDMNTRYGDCILVYDDTRLIVYDCGHEKHAEEVEGFLRKNSSISQVHIVVSHNDSDHTDGIVSLMEYLYTKKYAVTVYTSLYLKSTDKVLEILDDGRRTPKATREHILKIFNKICDIVLKAQEYGFAVKDARINTLVSDGAIVGPKEEEFAGVVAAAIEAENTGKKIDGETVMNAASVQLKVRLDNRETVLLCGDATPEYLHNLNIYDVIQLPHHGKLDNAVSIFGKLNDRYGKIYLISDNTGSGVTSGGSDELVKYLEEEKFSAGQIKNTKNKEVNIPESFVGNIGSNCSRTQGVRLGEMDYQCR